MATFDVSTPPVQQTHDSPPRRQLPEKPLHPTKSTRAPDIVDPDWASDDQESTDQNPQHSLDVTV